MGLNQSSANQNANHTLELLGAVLLVRLVERVAKILDCSVIDSHVSCDSTTVLAWLKNQTRKTSDPDEIDLLTPGHFLVGLNLLEPQTYDYGKEANGRLATYHRIISSFWRTWSKNYVAQLQRRSKWKFVKANIQPGDIVLMKEDSSPLVWPLAKVINVVPDKHGQVRILNLRSGTNEYVRSVQKVVVLQVIHNP